MKSPNMYHLKIPGTLMKSKTTEKQPELLLQKNSKKFKPNFLQRNGRPHIITSTYAININHIGNFNIL